MQLIRFGDLRGINLDMLVSWEIEAPAAPEHAPPGEPDVAPAPEEAPPASAAAPATAPVAPPAAARTPAGTPAAARAPAAAPVATTATVRTPAAAPAPAPPATPTPAPPATPAPAPEEASSAPERSALRMTLTLASGSAMQTLSLEGREAEAMRAYLQSKSGALIR